MCDESSNQLEMARGACQFILHVKMGRKPWPWDRDQLSLAEMNI